MRRPGRARRQAQWEVRQVPRPPFRLPGSSTAASQVHRRRWQAWVLRGRRARTLRILCRLRHRPRGIHRRCESRLPGICVRMPCNPRLPLREGIDPFSSRRGRYARSSSRVSSILRARQRGRLRNTACSRGGTSRGGNPSPVVRTSRATVTAQGSEKGSSSRRAGIRCTCGRSLRAFLHPAAKLTLSAWACQVA